MHSSQRPQQPTRACQASNVRSKHELKTVPRSRRLAQRGAAVLAQLVADQKQAGERRTRARRTRQTRGTSSPDHVAAQEQSLERAVARERVRARVSDAAVLEIEARELGTVREGPGDTGRRVGADVVVGETQAQQGRAVSKEVRKRECACVLNAIAREVEVHQRWSWQSTCQSGSAAVPDVIRGHVQHAKPRAPPQRMCEAGRACHADFIAAHAKLDQARARYERVREFRRAGRCDLVVV